MLATFLAPGGGTGKNATLFFVALVFSFDFFAPRTDGVPHFGPPSGLDFGGFWSNFGSMLGPSWRYLGALGHKRWHWMGWWGYAKRKEFGTGVLHTVLYIQYCIQIGLRLIRS